MPSLDFDDTFYVDHISNHRTSADGHIEYLVHFVGFQEPEWVAEHDIQDADLIKSYLSIKTRLPLHLQNKPTPSASAPASTTSARKTNTFPPAVEPLTSARAATSTNTPAPTSRGSRSRNPSAKVIGNIQQDIPYLFALSSSFQDCPFFPNTHVDDTDSP